MEILLTPEQWVLNLYPQNNSDVNLKLSNYIVKTEYENEILILHTITWAIYALSKEEFNNILTNEILIKNKVVIPTDFKENEVANRVYVARMTNPELPTYTHKMDDYTILTTTSCNARCFYCYENGIDKNITMNTETAEDIVQLIAKDHVGDEKPIKLHWFGGEPLLNKRVINYIVDRLTELNIPYYSTIISNGILLNQETIEDAKRWNLKNIQITLDGTYDTYNQIKNYVYTDIDAYLTLIDNIHRLLDNIQDVNVGIKFNATNKNIFKLYDDINLLKEEYKNHINKNISFYVGILYDYIQDTETAVQGYWEEIERLKKIAHIKEPNIRMKFFKEPIYNRKHINFHCKSYSGDRFIILPNGKLTVCDLIRDEDIFGDIYNGITNVDVLKSWQNFDSSEIDYCKTSMCPLHPMCPKFFKCNSCGICFKPEHIEETMKLAEEKLIRTRVHYNNVLNKK